MSNNLTNTFVGLIQEGVQSMRAISDPKDKAMVAAELAKAVASTGLVGLLENAEGVEMTASESKETKEAIKEGAPGKTNKPAKPAKTVPAKPAKLVKPVKEEAAQEESEPEIIETKPEEQEEAIGQEETLPESTVTESSEDTEEWTEEAIEKYADDLEYINQIREAYGDEGIEACISDFSEGVYSTFEDISPLNVKGFAAYLEMLVKDAEAAE
jgi:hypothetical protein